MAFTVNIYGITDDPRALTKNLIFSGANQNRISSGTINFKQGHDMLRPVFNYRITTSTTVEKLRLANYLHDATNNRYYFIDKVVVNPTNDFEFTCRLDVLMTYNAQLKALNCTLDRSETIFNGYLPDSEFKSLGYRAIACVAFPSALNQDSFILMTTG